MPAKQGVGDGTGMGSAPEKDGTAAEDVERIGHAEGLIARLRAPLATAGGARPGG
jgi:hypothetical protein